MSDDHHVYEVIVIGAGISGLGAANELKQKGINTLVLEARDRIGGRIHTINPWGASLDLGASWIHGIENNPIAEITKKYNIKTVETDFDDSDYLKSRRLFAVYDTCGRRLNQKEVDELLAQTLAFDQYLSKTREQYGHLSLRAVFDIYCHQNQIKDENYHKLYYFLSNMYACEYGDDLSLLSNAVQLPYEKSNVDGANVIFTDGYNQVIKRLAQGLQIRFNQQVKKIDYQDNTIEIRTLDRLYRCRYLITSLPLGVLKAGDVEFLPDLPSDKIEAISSLKMGAYNKMYLYFEDVFWDKDSEWLGYIPQMHEVGKTLDFMNYYKYVHQPILLIFSGASLAKILETWSDQKVIDYMMQQLKIMYGKKVRQPTSYIRTNWVSDRYSYGSFSCLPVGVSHHMYQALAKPIDGRIFFVGEATSSTDPSTVHGAFTSGVEAAKQVALKFKDQKLKKNEIPIETAIKKNLKSVS
ncbi:FAD-dependent oxidoreductase [Thiotrichales bacterium 19S3-7]|nr:FAD-dependent oxidoreductase [Thiotrichales bacterium 19S3-7]MCF6802174.1 FAD-dependent oxidoreductase [Thiotrichales bacterium 19S3-11]